MSCYDVYTAMKESGAGWMGTIPCSWTKQPLKYLFAIKKNIAGEPGHTVLSVTQKGIKPKQMSDRGQFALDYSKYQLVQIGDFIMNHMDLLTGWVDISDQDGVTSPDYRVFTNTSPDQCVSEFYKYVFQYCYSNRIFYGLGQGVSGFGRWRLPADMFLNFSLPVPPIKEQTSIAAYLDDQCAQIDATISDVKASIEEYKAWKASIIYEAVTKGLDPNTVTKDSGVEWIGRIPNQWNVTTIGRYLDSIQTGPFGSQLHADEYIEGGIPVINPANIKEGEIIVDKKCTISERKASELCQHLLIIGDIVLGRRGEMGRCACVHTPDRLLCGTGCIRIRCSSDLLPEYAAFYLQMPLVCRYLELNSVGTTMMNLNTSIISNIPFACPSVSEQRDIVSLLRSSCTTIEKLITDKQSLITDLESFRKSLIYEVVTGKRKVV